jgi:deoxycytidylate deaminase
LKFFKRNLSVQDRARLDRAKNVAATSDCRYMHGAVAVRGGRILAVGINSYRNTFPLFDMVPPYGRSLHAEEACLKALGGEADGVTMYVARVNRRGEEMMSKPCNACTQLLRDAGVKKVVYTIDSQISL